MAKIVLNNVVSGYDLTKIRDNFDKIAIALNDKVYWRDCPVGEFNQLLTDMDTNGKRIYNLPDPIQNGEPATKGWITTVVGDAPQAALEAAASAELAEAWASQLVTKVDGVSFSSKQYAANAESSAESASLSESNCANYAAVGFNVASTIYDFGLITDPAYTFNSDYGTVP